MTIEHKVLHLTKASIDDHGTLSGYGAAFNNLDDGGDIIEPGFFAPVLKDFIREGFISAGHDWNQPIAMVMSAVEDDYGLFITAKYHSDPESQRYRTIAAERMAEGKQVGLSIGYDVAPGGAKRMPDGRHLLLAKRLFEVAQVTVPMNREAVATSVKSTSKAAADNVAQAAYCLMTLNELIESESVDAASGDADATDDATDVAVLLQARDWLLAFIEAESSEVGTEPDLQDVAEEAAASAQLYGYMGRRSFADHLSSVTAAVKAAAVRARSVSRLRKEGRVLSSANRTRLEGLIEALAATEADVRDLLASTDPEKGAHQEIDIEYELMRARLAGVLLN